MAKAERQGEQSGAGRPTKYLPEYDERLIEHMAKGLSFESFAGELQVAIKTLYNWAEANPSFAAAKEVGFARCRVWWENLGQKIARGVSDDHVLTKELERETPDGTTTERVYGPATPNAATWYANMKNRFGWRDKTELSGDPDRPVVLADMATLQPSGKGT